MANDPNNIIPDRTKKLHEIYVEKFGDSDFEVTRGFEVGSRDYQLRLARRTLIDMKERMLGRKETVFHIKGIKITVYGNKTKEEIENIKQKFLEKIK